MNYTAEFFRPGILQNIQRVLCRVPGMDDNRQSGLSCQFQLLFKPFFLYGRFRLFPVIIQADFPDRHHLFTFTAFFQPSEFLLVKLRRLTRMHSYRAINKGILFHERNCFPAAFQTGSYINHRINSVLCKRPKKRLPVFVKCPVIIMSMAFKYHCSSSPK